MARDVSKLHPRLQSIIAELKKKCNEQGLKLGIGECFRSVEEQDALYAQGRTKPGKVVTKAKGSSYSSQHQWGIAVDFFKNVKGQEYSDSAFFTKVATIAKSLGLGWGGDWTSFKDRPHLYLPDWGSTTKQLKSEYGTPEKFMATWKTTPKATLATAQDKLQQALNIKEGDATLKDAQDELKAALKITNSSTSKKTTNSTTTIKKVSDVKMPTIKRGFKGKAVRVWQAIIGVTVDGDFGEKTETATIAFQKKVFPNNKKEWDGVVGDKTWKAGLESV